LRGGLTNANGCDSTAVLNLTINQGDTSYTNITACDSVVWNGTTYTQSGTYSYSSGGSNNYSMTFDGNDDYVDVGSSDSLMIIGDLSISFNINLDVPQSYWQEILTYSTWGESLTTNALYYIEIPPNTNTLNYLHEYGGGNNEVVVLNYNLNPNQWYSITIVRDSQNKDIYFVNLLQ
jgi:hypothetical protein